MIGYQPRSAINKKKPTLPFNLSVVSVVSLIIGFFFLFILALNMFTIVQDGSVKVGTNISGKVIKEPYLPGFHLLPHPFISFDTYSTKDIKVPLQAVRVPSQDKLKSLVDITVMLKLNGSSAPKLKINVGTENQAIDIYVRQKLISTILEFGKDVANAQDLYTADVQRMLQESIRDAIQTYAEPYGYTIKEIMIQDITLPDVVQEQVVNTKVRQEQINQAKAETAREEELAQKKVKQATADRAVREQLALATERDAEAKLYAATKEAEANAALQRTITPEMIKWRQLEIDQIKANKYKGDVPHTIVGSDYDGKMIMDMRNK